MSGPLSNPVSSPADLIRIEASALVRMAERLEGPQRRAFEAAVDLVAGAVRNGGKVVLTGVGKSGLIARKIAATLVSTGTQACFLHPSDAVHGDIGMLCPEDVVLALSYSGETDEVLRLLPSVRDRGLPLISLTGCTTSKLANASSIALDISVEREACNHDLAPTASTTAMLAMGDALAVTLSHKLGFVPESFAERHPGGQIGRRLTPVRELMHTGDTLPVVDPQATLPEIMHEMSAKRLGMTTVQKNGNLIGVLSDGDLRRLMEREGPDAFHRTAAEVMNPRPRTVGPEIFAYEAIALMEAHKITSLVVTPSGTAGEAVLGIVHMHDILQSVGVAAKRG